VTQNVPDAIQNLLPKAASVSSWAPSYFKNPPEYSFFMGKYRDLFVNGSTKVLNLTEAMSLLTFDKLLNGVMISNAFIYNKNSNISKFNTTFFFD